MDTLVTVAPLIGTGLLLVLGLVGWFRPQLILSPLDIRAENGPAMCELRAVFGGVMMGMVVAVGVTRAPAAFLVLGSALIGAGCAKIYSMVVDNAGSSVVGGIAIDFAIGAAVVTGYFAA